MPRFQYRALDADGATHAGVIEAASRADAVKQLQARGQFPIRADPVRKSFPPAWRWMAATERDAALTLREVQTVTRDLATLLDGGLTLERGLDLVAAGQTKRAIAAVVEGLRRAVSTGATLSDALSRYPRSFDPLVISMIRAGEAGGALKQALGHLADYLDRSLTMRSAVITALLYPAIVLVVTVLSVAILLTVVVPQFAPLFEGSEAMLPWLTRAVFGVGTLLQGTWWILVLILAAGAFWLRARWRAGDFRHTVHERLRRAPVLGGAWASLDTSRLARTLALLLRQGVSLPAAVTIAAPVVTNVHARRGVQTIAVQLREGRSFAHAVREAGLLAPPALALLEVGETAGQLIPTLERLADQHAADIDTRVKRLLTLLEPVLILGLGAVIGLIVVALLLGILSINDLVV